MIIDGNHCEPGIHYYIRGTAEVEENTPTTWKHTKRQVVRFFTVSIQSPSAPCLLHRALRLLVFYTRTKFNRFFAFFLFLLLLVWFNTLVLLTFRRHSKNRPTRNWTCVLQKRPVCRGWMTLKEASCIPGYRLSGNSGTILFIVYS